MIPSIVNLLLWSIFLPGPGTPNVVQLTDNGVDENGLVLSDNYIAWLSDGTLICYDIARESFLEISTGETKNNTLSLDGETLVWVSGQNEKSEIRIFDLYYLFEYQLKTDGIADSDPQVAGNHIAWKGKSASELFLFIHNLETNVSTRIRISYPEFSFNLGKQFLVWSDMAENGTEVYSIDLKTGVKQQLTQNSLMDDRPSVYADHIIWNRQGNGGVSDIFLYYSKEKRDSWVSTFSGESHPMINSNRIAWRNGLGRKSEIHMYDINDKSEMQVTDNNYAEESVLIGRDHLVWLNKSASYPRLNIYHIEKGTTLQPANLYMSGADIKLSKDLIAWTAFDGHDREVFFYYLP